MAELGLTFHRDSTRTDPAGEPTSSPATTVATTTGGLTGSTIGSTGTGTSAGATIPRTANQGPELVGQEQTSEDTSPQIWINTALDSDKTNAVQIQFDYMPESVSFGVVGNFEPRPIMYTSARWLTYQGSDIEEVSLVLKVVAGCNNCITYYSSNTRGSDFLAKSPLRVGRYERNNLINLAKALYSLPLPGNNLFADGKGKPPPTCRLKVGKMFSGVGAFTRCSIAFNGPYDFDGSPTDMEVSLGFMPSEFYDSTKIFGFGEGLNLKPISTPTGDDEIGGVRPYALYFGETQTGLGTEISPSGTPTAANTPNAGPELAGEEPAKVPEAGVQGPTGPTPTNEEAAIAMGYPHDSFVYYDQGLDRYTFGGTPVTSGGIVIGVSGGDPYTGNVVRSQVDSQKPGSRGD